MSLYQTFMDRILKFWALPSERTSKESNVKGLEMQSFSLEEKVFPNPELKALQKF